MRNTARKTIFSFSRRPEKMVFPKKSRWNMIFLVLLGKIMFLFLENMILILGGKWKMIFFKKVQGDMIFSSGLSKRRSFQKRPRWDMIFLVLSGKMGFFSPENTIFFPWAGSQRWSFARNTWKYDIFCVDVWVLQTWCHASLPKKSRMALSRKNTPKGDWRSRLRSWKELHQFSVPSQRPLRAPIALQPKEPGNLIYRTEVWLLLQLIRLEIFYIE